MVQSAKLVSMLVFSSCSLADAFTPTYVGNSFARGNSMILDAKKTSGKGFGAPKVEETKSKSAVVEDSNTSIQNESAVRPEPIVPTKTAGQIALEKLREGERAKKDEELRRVKKMRDIDAQVTADPNAGVIPERVAQRMTKRMLPFVGIPLFGVMGTFVTFWYLRVYKDMVFETVVVAATTIAVLVASLLGITYSVMSASWDEDKEGSFLGVEEFQSNVQSIKEGLGRSRETAVLRDRMTGLSEDEIESALQDLERRDKKKEKKGMSFQQKLEQEGL